MKCDGCYMEFQSNFLKPVYEVVRTGQYCKACYPQAKENAKRMEKIGPRNTEMLLKAMGI